MYGQKKSKRCENKQQQEERPSDVCMMYIQIIYMMTSCIFVSLHYNHHHQQQHQIYRNLLVPLKMINLDFMMSKYIPWNFYSILCVVDILRWIKVILELSTDLK
jgi:hypothetical protein